MIKKLLTCLLISLMTLTVAFAQEVTVSGQVTGEDGVGIPGISIFVKGTTQGTVSDASGSYSISVNQGVTLVFQGIGLVQQEIVVGSQTTINVQMVSSVGELEEVVVVGFGETDRKNNIGSVVSVKADEFKNFNATSFEQVLQGRAPGVQVSATSGALGSPITVNVRGVSSITSSSQPLFVIDGIPLNTSDDAIGTDLSGSGGFSGQNPLSNINPNDIASIEILKDASATAIYGARAANGVVLITTKRGTIGKPRVSLSYYAGFTDHTPIPEYLNGEQFTELWNANIDGAEQVLGAPAGTFDGFRLPTEDIINTDWTDLVTRQGFVQNANFNVSGGNEYTQYFVGGTFQDTEGYILNHDFQRYSFRANIIQKLNDKVKVELLLNPTYSVLNRISESNQVQAPFTLAALQYPNIPAFDDEGNTVRDPGPNPFLLAFNSSPLIDVTEAQFESRLRQVIANFNVEYKPFAGLVVRAEFGVDALQLTEDNKDGERTTNGQPNGDGRAVSDEYLNWNFNGYATYNKTFNDVHNFRITSGLQLNQSKSQNFVSQTQNFPSDQFKTLTSGATVISANGSDTEYSFIGLFSRINYGYKGKYLAEFTVRGDASSRFGANNKWGVFPAGALGWVVSEEAFMQNVDFINFLKLRASFGIQGNAEITNFAARTLFGTVFQQVQVNYNDIPGVFLSQIADEDLKWETTTQFDVGIETGFLKNRFRLSFNYYYKETTDLLLGSVFSSANPDRLVTRNVGEMTNQGIEVDLTANILSGDFTWVLNVNAATIKNEVTRLVDNDGDGTSDDIINTENITREGEPLGSFFIVPFAGVDPSNGDALFLGLDGETTSAYTLSNRRILGDPFPDIFGGFTNTFGYKGIDINVFFQYSLGRDMFVDDGRFNADQLGSIFNNLTTQLNYWTPENPNTNIPQPRSPILSGDANGGQTSSRYLQDGSYLRLKSLSIGYTFPESITKNVSLRIFAQAQNLWTVTADDFTGLDPEINFSANDNQIRGNTFFGLPQTKTFTFGVDLSF